MEVTGFVRAAIMAGALAVLASVPVGAVTTASGASRPKNIPAQDWTMFHRDALRSGLSGEAAIGQSSAPGLALAWSAPLGVGSVSSPAVVTVPSLGKTLVYVGTNSNSTTRSHVEAFDAATGALIWSHRIGKPIQGSPAVVGGYVYVGSSDHILYVLSGKTGHLVCSFVTTGIISSSPVVANPDGTGPVVYFGDSGPSGGHADGGHVWAVTGVGNPAGPCQLKWSFSSYGDPPGSQSGTAGTFDSPAFAVDANGRPLVVFGSTDPDAAVYAVDARDGSLAWRVQTVVSVDGDVGAAPTIAAPGIDGFVDGVAYIVGKDGVAYAIDLTTGAVIWQTDASVIDKHALNSESGPVLIGNVLCMGYGSDAGAQGGMLALNATTGESLWTTAAAPIVASPAVSGAAGDRVILAADNTGTMRAYSPDDGSILWTNATSVPIFSSFAISHGKAYVASLDGNLYAFAPPA